MVLTQFFAAYRLSAVVKDCYGTRDNLGRVEWAGQLCGDPIDLVYTWVNGSDPLWQADMLKWRNIELGDELMQNVSLQLEPEGNSTDGEPPDPSAANRYRDNDELLYSMRSVFKYAPWVRNIILVTNGQVPSWLNLDHPRIRVVTHAEIFAHPDALPVFSSPAIEMNLHRIPGLSRRFLYFNDDVLLGSPVQPEDFDSPSFGQRVFMDWAVPRCHAGCVETWIGDGYCDHACNVSACLWDAGDCSNGTVRTRHSPTITSGVQAPCVPGCPSSWIADKMCDARCNVRQCAFDGGDCGLGPVQQAFPGDAAVAGLLQSDQSGSTLLLADTGNDAGDNPWDILAAAVAHARAAATVQPKSKEATKTDKDFVVSVTVRVTVVSPAAAAPEAPLPTTTSAIASPSPQPGRSTNLACRQLTALCSTPEDCAVVGWKVAMAQAWQHTAAGADVVTEDAADMWSLNVSIPGRQGSTLVLPTHQFPISALPVSVNRDAAFYLNVSQVLHATHAYGLTRIAAAIAAQNSWSGLSEGSAGAERDPESCAVQSAELLSTCQAIASSEAGASTPQSIALKQWQTECHSLSASIDLLPSDLAHIARQVDFAFSGGARSKTDFVRRAAVWAPLKQVVVALDVESIPTAAQHFSQNMRMSEAAIVDAATHMARAHGLITSRGNTTATAARELESASSWGKDVSERTDPHGEGHTATELSTDVDVDDLMLRSDAARWAVQRSQRQAREQAAARSIASSASPLDILRPVDVAQVSLLLHIKAEGTLSPILLRHSEMCKGSGVRGTVYCFAMGQTVHALHVLSVSLRVDIRDTVLAESLPAKPQFWEEDTASGTKPGRSLLRRSHSQPDANAMLEMEFVASKEYSAAGAFVGQPRPPALSSWAQAHRAARSQLLSRANDVRNTLASHRAEVEHMRLAWRALVRQSLASPPAGAAELGATAAAPRTVPQMTQSGTRRALLDQYGLSLVFSNRVVNQAFGTSTRRVPAHMPHLINRDVVQKLVERFPAEVLATEHHRFRHARDLQYAFVYFHFLMAGGSQPSVDLTAYWRQELDTDLSGRLEWNELRTLAAVVFGKVPETGPARDLLQCLLPGFPVPQSVDITQLSAPVPPVSFDAVVQCSLAVQGLREHARFPPTHADGDKSEVGFQMIVDNINITRNKLDGLRARKPKFICINDDMHLAPPEVQQTVHDFFSSIVPLACPAELPPGSVNPQPLYLDVLLLHRAASRWAIAKLLFLGSVLAAAAWMIRRRLRLRSRSSKHVL